MIKRRILNIALLLVLIYSIDFAIGRTLRHLYFTEKSGFHYRTTYAIDSTKADILVFGASRANHHYVPDAFEDALKMTFYNTGRDGNGLLFQTGVLQAVLKRYTPKLVILDFYGSFDNRNITYDTPSLLPYYRTHEEIRKIIELNNSFVKEKLISEIYPFNSQISSIIIGNLDSNKKRHGDIKGYIPLYNKLQVKADSLNTDKLFPSDSAKVNMFRDFLKTIKKSGADVVVIFSPIYLNFKQLQKITICRDLCALENVPFWDFSKDTLFLNNRQLFHDFDHLNNTGAKMFSDIIAGKIKSEVFKTQHVRD